MDCKVCKSPNREDYEHLRVEENKTFRDLEEIAKKQKGEDISYQSFWNHFNKHFKPIVEKRLEGTQKGKELVDKKIGETLDVIEELRENVNILKKILNNVLDTEEENLSAKKINAVNSSLREIRITLKTLSDLTKNLTIKGQDTEDEKEQLLNKIRDLPDEWAEPVLKALEGDLDDLPEFSGD